MNRTQWQFTYLDFDGQVKSGTATVHEPEEGMFYVMSPQFGCGKTCGAGEYWHPVKAALQALVGLDRPLKSYAEYPG